jgi:hypothetical protein
MWLAIGRMTAMERLRGNLPGGRQDAAAVSTNLTLERQA